MYPRLIIRQMLDGESVMLSNTKLSLGFLCISIIHLIAHFCCFSWYTHLGRNFRFENALCHLVAALFEILKQVRVLLKSTGRHIDSPVENHAKKKDILRGTRHLNHNNPQSVQIHISGTQTRKQIHQPVDLRTLPRLHHFLLCSFSLVYSKSLIQSQPR